jgi:lipid II:glycine glycyltransferase (peptidoglycan interpeptide bridge formation enzyme)
VLYSVDSWLTGNRLVSVPFSDHCELLLDDGADCGTVYAALVDRMALNNPVYIELRPISSLNDRASFFSSQERYWLHVLDLSPDLPTLFRNCHKDSTQRKIRRAERERLTYDAGRSDTLLEAFYDPLLLTRRRHGTPPQPKLWFRNLIDFFGESLTIRVASKGSQPVAAILTVRHQVTVVSKYGCSNVHFHNLSGMQCLFWRTIQEAKAQHLLRFDLGRSDVDNAGLIRFKTQWGL